MYEFKLPDSTNSLCDDESELCESSHLESETLFNKINDKSTNAKIMNVGSTLSTKYSDHTGTTRPLLITAVMTSVSNVLGNKSQTQQVETDD